MEGFNDDKSKISGVYAIPAGGTVNVNGQTFTVPNKSDFSIWGGVYLEGAGIYNTSYESDDINNTCVLLCKSKYPLTLSPITPNAPYRENTEVISSYWLINNGPTNYTPSSGLSVRFRVYNAYGTLIKTVTKANVIVPASDKNLVYFKWTVPSGLNYRNITIKADISDGGTYYSLVSKTYSTVPYLKYTAPDTRYEEKAPSGFRIPTTPAQNANCATWWEYGYTGSAFVKRSYGIGINTIGTNGIIPKSGTTAELKNGSWTMKSGYGFTAKSAIGTVNISTYLAPSTSMYTQAQYAYITFPEYGYSYGSGQVQNT